MSARFSAEWAASTSASNKPGTESLGSVKPTSGGAASSQPTFPESPATPTFATYGESFNLEVIEDEAPTLRLGTSIGLPTVPLIFSAAASPAKTSLSPANAADSCTKADDPTFSSSAPASQMSFYDPEAGSSLRTYPDSFPLTVAEISVSFSRRWPTSGSTTLLGECWTHDSSESPSGGGVSSSLRDVLEESVPDRYFLSPKAAAGILRRAEKRGRELPPHLLAALRVVAESTRPDDAKRTT